MAIPLALFIGEAIVTRLVDVQNGKKTAKNKLFFLSYLWEKIEIKICSVIKVYSLFHLLFVQIDSVFGAHIKVP